MTKNALFGGRRGGIFCALGVATGLAIWTVAAALGLAALLHASDGRVLRAEDRRRDLSDLDRVCRCSATRGLADPDDADAATRTVARRGRRCARACSPISATRRSRVFFTSFLPQFVHGDGSAFLSLVLLGLIFCVLTLLWLILYGVLIGHGSSFLRRPRVRRGSTVSPASSSSASASASPSNEEVGGTARSAS